MEEFTNSAFILQTTSAQDLDLKNKTKYSAVNAKRCSIYAPPVRLKNKTKTLNTPQRIACATSRSNVSPLKSSLDVPLSSLSKPRNFQTKINHSSSNARVLRSSNISNISKPTKPTNIPARIEKQGDKNGNILRVNTSAMNTGTKIPRKVNTKSTNEKPAKSGKISPRSNPKKPITVKTSNVKKSPSQVQIISTLKKSNSASSTRDKGPQSQLFKNKNAVSSTSITRDSSRNPKSAAKESLRLSKSSEAAKEQQEQISSTATTPLKSPRVILPGSELNPVIEANPIISSNPLSVLVAGTPRKNKIPNPFDLLGIKKIDPETSLIAKRGSESTTIWSPVGSVSPGYKNLDVLSMSEVETTNSESTIDKLPVPSQANPTDYHEDEMHDETKKQESIVQEHSQKVEDPLIKSYLHGDKYTEEKSGIESCTNPRQSITEMEQKFALLMQSIYKPKEASAEEPTNVSTQLQLLAKQEADLELQIKKLLV